MSTLAYTDCTESDLRYPPLTGEPNKQGMLNVSEDPKHTLHWEEWGNPQGEPLIIVHGGPGGGLARSHARICDPNHYRIILFDQRGCGKSEPHASVDPVGGLAENHTTASIADIEKLREQLGIEKMRVYGGSWGTTLGLAYAQAHPERVKSLTLRGIFLCDHDDLSYFYQGNAANPEDTSIPGAYRAYLGTGEEAYAIPAQHRDERMADAYAKAWKRYVAAIPEAERGDMIAAYHRRFTDASIPEAERLEALMAWSHWEDMTSYLNFDVSKPTELSEPHKALAFSRIENGYFHRALTGGDPAISGLLKPENLRKLKGIPIDIVHGKQDQVCFVGSARKLKAALEQEGVPIQSYTEVDGAGHSLMEKGNYAGITAVVDKLAGKKQWATAVLENAAASRLKERTLS